MSHIEQLRSVLAPEVSACLDDSDLNRFLTARQLDISKAKDMVNNWHTWYHAPLPNGISPKNILDEVQDRNEDVFRQFMPHSNVGEDVNGNPIYWEETGLISSRFSKIKAVFSEDDLFIRHIRQQEMMVRRIKYLAKKYDRPIEKQIIVLNMKGLSYSLDTTALNTFLRTVKIDESCYPQRLETLYIINSPFFFRAVWALVSPFIDPVTATKIKILGSDYINTLKQVIPEERIPAVWGGADEAFPWQWPHNFDPLACLGLDADATAAAAAAADAATSASAGRGAEVLDTPAEAVEPEVRDEVPDMDMQAMAAMETSFETASFSTPTTPKADISDV